VEYRTVLHFPLRRGYVFGSSLLQNSTCPTDPRAVSSRCVSVRTDIPTCSRSRLLPVRVILNVTQVTSSAFRIGEFYALNDRLCGLVVRVPGSIPSTTRKKKVVGLERGPLSLMNTTEELLGRKSSGSGLEIREYGCREP
jgi:hypothetical protein